MQNYAKKKRKEKRLLLLPVYFIHQSFTALFSTQYLLLFSKECSGLLFDIEIYFKYWNVDAGYW
jgi:hypothetical protein